MITTTLGAIAKGAFTGGEASYRIYVISVGDIPLYVGRSSDAVTRVLSHLGMGEWIGFYGSAFDRVIKDYKGWKKFTVTLYTGDDVLIWAAARYPHAATIDKTSPYAQIFYDTYMVQTTPDPCYACGGKTVNNRPHREAGY